MKGCERTPRTCPHELVSVEMIRKLLGLEEGCKGFGLPLTKVKALTGASTMFIKMARDNPKQLAKRGCLCRYCPRDELTQEEVDYLCSEQTLHSWRTFSLLQRTQLFARRYRNRKLSVSKLRKVYRLNGIKLRNLKFTMSLTPT